MLQALNGWFSILVMQTVRSFIEQVGRREFEVHLDVSAQAVSRAMTDNIMPAGWYLGAAEIAAAKKVPVSKDLFRWTHKIRREGAGPGGIRHAV